MKACACEEVGGAEGRDDMGIVQGDKCIEMCWGYHVAMDMALVLH